MDPVNIDFILGGNVDEQAPKTKQALDGVADAGKTAIEQTQQRIQDTKSNIAQVEADLKKLQKSFDNAAPGNTKEFFGKELGAAKKALEEEKNILGELESKVNTTGASHARLRTQIMTLKDELAKLEMQGKRNTPEYRAMAVELGRLNDQMGDTNMQVKILADDQKGFRAVASAASGMAGAMSAAVGVAALMGAENEELTKIQTRLQAVMAITIGLQQVSETLNKDSYFSVVLLSKAKLMWSAANVKVATTLGISNVAAKALMATVTLGLSVAITALIYIVDKLITKNKEQKKAAEEAAKAQKEAAKSTADDYGKELTKVESLRAALNSENVTRDQKLGIIKKLNSIMPGYTAELDKEGRVIRENKAAIDDYMSSLEKSIKLKVEESRLSELFSQRYEIEQKTFSRPVAKTVQEAGFLDRQEDDFNAWKNAELEKIDSATAEIKNRINTAGLISIIAPEKETKASKEKKEAFDAAKAIQDQLLEINKQTADLLFEQRADNLQKTLDAIDNAKNAELAKISQKEQEIVDKYNTSNKDKKGFMAATSISDIDPALAKQNQEAAAALTAAYNAKRKQTEQDYMDDLTKMAAEAADTRVKIENDYESQIKNARENGFEAYAKLLEGERDKKISDTTASIITETQAYKLATDDQLIISKETTEKLIALIKQRVAAELAAGKITKERAKEILDSIDASGADKGSSNNPFANLIKGLNDYKKAKESIATSKASGASVEELAKLEGAANSALKSIAGAAGTSLAGVTDILAMAVDGLNELGLLTEEEKKTADQVIGMVNGAANLAMGIASGNPVQIIQGSIELLVNAFKLFDKKSKNIEKAQKKAKADLDDLTKSYEKLQRAVDKALGTDVYKKQREQTANLIKQNQEYDRLIELERQKKKKKQDQQAIEDWEKLKQDNLNQIEDIVDNISESIAQTSARDLAADLANSLVEAFASGATAAEAMGDVIDDVIKRAVLNALKLRYLEKPLEKIIDTFSEDMESGGKLTGAEADKFRKSVEALGEDFYAAWEMANQALDGIFSGSQDAIANKGGIKGDVANMTEQTGTALVGQLAAMRLNVAAILATSKNTGESMTRVFAIMERIRDNTEYCRKLERIDENIQYLKSNGIGVN